MKKKPLVHIGTSGWHYDHWSGPFYPKDLSKEGFLPYYAERFHTVEINNSFYQLPQKATFHLWRNTTQRGFIFSVKASRYMTHMKKLKDPERPLSAFLDRVDVMKDRLGPILFQLPPRWRINTERLKGFLEALPTDHRYAFEFRDPSWFHRDTLQALEGHGAAFCIYELAGRRSPKEITSDFVYIRLHGPEGPYEGKYTKQDLSGWAGAISSWVTQGKEVYCYFDNDQAGYAVQNALELQDMMGG
jgi:uncharacterized protein YecE (DUF72 family)